MTLLSRTAPICHTEPQREGPGAGLSSRGTAGVPVGDCWGGAAAVRFRLEWRRERMRLHGEFCPHCSVCAQMWREVPGGLWAPPPQHTTSSCTLNLPLNPDATQRKYSGEQSDYPRSSETGVAFRRRMPAGRKTVTSLPSTFF